jgi:DNA-binding MarR family transcriptional regulator
MQLRGLVTRRPDPLDGRRVLVEFTPTGRAALVSLAVQHREELRRTAPALIEVLQTQFVKPSTNRHSTSMTSS